MPQLAWLIVGLGNPGPDHTAARHNVGFRVVAALASAAGACLGGPKHGARWARATVGGQPVVLIQPQEYMNCSGPPTAAWLGQAALGSERLLVIHDDLDLEVGRVKVAAGGGDGGHRGLRSIGEALGDPEFLRVRVGVGRPAGGGAVEFVLGTPGEAEAEGENLRAAEARAAAAVRAILAEGPAAAMNRFNPWPPPCPAVEP